MRAVGSALLAATMLISSAFAGTTDPVGPLAPGKPAGVKKAQAESSTLIWVLGIGLVIGGVALVASGGSKAAPTGSSSSGSNP